MGIVMLGIDLDKTLCSLAGQDETGAVALRRRLRRNAVEAFVEKLPCCTVALKACFGGIARGRHFRAFEN